MVSYYSIIQYVPDPIADERINIGVITFDENNVRVQFLMNWERVRHFGKGNIDFLKDFAKRMKESAAIGLLFPGDKQGKPKYDRLDRVARGWINSIQFTEPNGSLEDVESLLKEIVESCLIEPHKHKAEVHDRQYAVRLTKSRIKKILDSQFGTKAKELLKTNYFIPGNLTSNEFDVVVANGQPYFAAQGLSFEVKVPQENQISIAWKIRDVKERSPDFPLAIVMLPPKEESRHYKQLQQMYDETTKIYRNIGADVLHENEIEGWVLQQIGDDRFSI